MIVGITNDNVSKTIKFHSVWIAHARCCYNRYSISITGKPFLYTIISIIHYINEPKWIEGDGRRLIQLKTPRARLTTGSSDRHTQG